MISMQDVRESLSGQAGVLCKLITAAMEPHLQPVGISLAMFELLSATHALKAKGTQASIARRLGITPPSLSETVRAALNLELIEQVPNPKDGRAKLIRLTPTGSKSLSTVLRAVRKIETAMIAGLSEDEISRAVQIMRKANRNLALSLQETFD